MLHIPDPKHLHNSRRFHESDANDEMFTQNSCCFYIGPSMHPTLKEQDLLEIIPYSRAQPQKGDVILFTPPGMHQAVIHRIIRIDGNSVITRGDNCSNTDPWRLHFSDLAGQVSAAYNDGVRRSIAGGLPGRCTAAYCRVRMHVLPKLVCCLKPALRFLQLIAVLVPFPSSVEPIRIIHFYNKTGSQYKLMRGTSTIGFYNYHSRQWHLTKRYRLFVGKSSLPGTPDCNGEINTTGPTQVRDIENVQANPSLLLTVR